MPSTLYVVGTPIGNLEDLTARAARVLGEVGAIAAEDTRVTARLLARVGVRKPMLSYRAPVERRGLPAVLRALEEGDVALVTDAGTPGVNDPGQRLVAAAVAAGHRVVPIPGPSAVAAALSVSGFSGDGYLFLGYLPRRPGELRRLLTSLEAEPRPAVAFDSPYRVLKSLAAIAEVLPGRQLLVGRELTKLHEELVRGSAAECSAALEGRAKGEFTLVIDGSKRTPGSTGRRQRDTSPARRGRQEGGGPIDRRRRMSSPTLPSPAGGEGDVSFVDTHLHLEEVEDPVGAVKEARAAGVTRLITMGTDLATSRGAVELAGRLEGVFAAAGHHAQNEDDPDLAAFRTLLADPRVVAVGEVGLDGSGGEGYAQMERQMAWFGSLCDLALEVGLPVSVHVREAADLVHRMLKARPGLTGVMHYFALDQAWADRFLDLGFHLSFAGLVTRATRDELREVARRCPADRLLLETDSPFGQPASRGREPQNRPAFLVDTAALVAEVRGITVEELGELEWRNAHSLFTRLP